MRVSCAGNHAVDLILAERCLDGDADAVASLQATYAAMLTSFLIGSGATPAEADDIVGSLWADCTVGTGGRAPRLEKYRGTSSLYTWLKTVALNELLDQKRRAACWRGIEARALAGEVQTPGTGLPDPGPAPEQAEAPLLQMLRSALVCALDQCPAESWVMLRLVHLNGLNQRDIARMFGWHESKVSRTMNAAMETIAVETQRAIAAQDPWIELKWSDFLDLCRCADFSLFS